MDNIFIDIGGHTGQSVQQFYKEIPDAANWKIFSFEPIEYNSLVRNVSKFLNVQCIRAAVGIKDGTIEMNLVPAHGQGATILKGKTTGGVDYQNKEQVISIDFIKWFNSNISPDNFVFIKMNIEGSEYILMPRLKEILFNIDVLCIKLHHNKFVIKEKKRLATIYEEFKEEVKNWRIKVIMETSDPDFKFNEILGI